MSDPQRPPDLYAHDHTELRDRPKRLWRFGDIGLPGLLLGGSVAALITLVAVWIGVYTLGKTLGAAWLGWIGAVLGLLAALVVYTAWKRPLPSKMRVSPALIIMLDWLFLQPREVHDFGKNREPSRLQWRVILWEPTDLGWIAARDFAHAYHLDLLQQGD